MMMMMISGAVLTDNRLTDSDENRVYRKNTRLSTTQ